MATIYLYVMFSTMHTHTKYMVIIESRDLGIPDISLPRASLQEYVETRSNIITYIQPLFLAMTMQL